MVHLHLIIITQYILQLLQSEDFFYLIKRRNIFI